jgi:hypothetical protein
VWSVEVSPSKLGVFFFFYFPKQTKFCFGKNETVNCARAAGGDEGQVIPQEESKLQGGNGVKDERNDWMKRRRRRGQHFTLGSGGGMWGRSMGRGAFV